MNLKSYSVDIDQAVQYFVRKQSGSLEKALSHIFKTNAKVAARMDILKPIDGSPMGLR